MVRKGLLLRLCGKNLEHFHDGNESRGRARDYFLLVTKHIPSNCLPTHHSLIAIRVSLTFWTASLHKICQLFTTTEQRCFRAKGVAFDLWWKGSRWKPTHQLDLAADPRSPVGPALGASFFSFTEKQQQKTGQLVFCCYITWSFIRKMVKIVSLREVIIT